MPAVRKTKKVAKPAKPYVKSEEGAKVKVDGDKPKADVGNGTYDRIQMFSDIIRGSKPDWPQAAKQVSKRANQRKDMWRKVILPALLDGRDWSASGSAGWNTKARIEVLVTVLKGINPDWTHVAAAQGRTVTQVKDVWRKVMQPKLLKGGTLS